MKRNSGPRHSWFLLLLTFFLPAASKAQIDWDNYATSFMGDGKEGTKPVLVTATPYNGVYFFPIDHSASPADLAALSKPGADGSLRPAMYRHTNTIDSGEVYFFAPGIHPTNTNRYEFRVLLDGRTELTPWQPITKFTRRDKNNNLIELNDFKPYFGFLGGWKAPWNHFVVVDLREKSNGQIICSAAAWWAPADVKISAIYTTRDLHDFLQDGKRTAHPIPASLTLEPEDNSLIIYVNTEIFKKEALEYQLKRNGQIYRPWQSNEFDNNSMLLQHLPPGEYLLQLRMRAQRHRVSGYSFRIKPAWYQTVFFKVLVAVFAILIFTTTFLLFKLIRQRRRTRQQQAHQEKLRLELRAIRSQLNPHFIFNALSSIQGLINQKDIDSANRYLSDFGQLLRDSLASSEKDLIELQQEINILDTYLQLEQLRFGFKYHIGIAPDTPPSGTEIPAALLQPLVENAVKHGVSGLREAGRIEISFSREKNGSFMAQVCDNGKGWTRHTEIKGYGLKLTEERIKVLNQLLKDNPVTMTVSSAPGTGTTVSLLFENWWT